MVSILSKFPRTMTCSMAGILMPFHWQSSVHLDDIPPSPCTARTSEERSMVYSPRSAVAIVANSLVHQYILEQLLVPILSHTGCSLLMLKCYVETLCFGKLIDTGSCQLMLSLRTTEYMWRLILIYTIMDRSKPAATLTELRWPTEDWSATFIWVRRSSINIGVGLELNPWHDIWVYFVDSRNRRSKLM